jgi:hypothetical protein
MSDERIEELAWAYVHGQLPAGERAEVAERLRSDEVLRLEVDEAAKLDAVLRSLLARAECSEESLEGRIVDEWERGAATGGGRRIVEFPERRPSDSGVRRHAVGLAVGIAAGALAVFGVVNQMRDPLRWAAPIVVEPAYRGGGVGSEAVQARHAVLESCAADVRRSVEAAYRRLSEQRGERGSARWVLSVKVEVTARGDVGAEVDVVSGMRNMAGWRWSRSFESAEALRAGTAAFGEEVAQALWDAWARRARSL